MLMLFQNLEIKLIMLKINSNRKESPLMSVRGLQRIHKPLTNINHEH